MKFTQLILALVLAACTPSPKPTTQPQTSVQAAADSVRLVALFLNDAADRLGPAHDAAREAQATAAALQVGNYTLAVQHARAGVDAAEAAGVPVPAEVRERLAQAELALGVATALAPFAKSLIGMMGRSVGCAWSGDVPLEQGSATVTCNSAYWTKTANVSYGPNAWNVFDKYTPTTGSGPRRAIVWFHGGGWSPPPIGSKNAIWEGIGLLCDLNAVFFSVEYRNRDQGDMLTQIHDATAFLRYVTANAASLGIDPARIAVAGQSVGGHMAAMVALGHGVTALQDLTLGNPTQDWSVKASVVMFPPTDFPNLNVDQVAYGCGTNPAPITAATAVMGCDVLNPACGAACATASPQVYADSSDPPMLLLHGSADCFIAPPQSSRLYDAIENAEGCVARRLVSGAAHGGTVWTKSGPRSAMAAFLNAVMP